MKPEISQYLNQKTVILRHLKRRPITQATAIDLYKIYRLADVIYKLRNDGFNIVTQPVKVKTVYGWTRIARYHLA